MTDNDNDWRKPGGLKPKTIETCHKPLGYTRQLLNAPDEFGERLSLKENLVTFDGEQGVQQILYWQIIFWKVINLLLVVEYSMWVPEIKRQSTIIQFHILPD